MSEIYVPKDLRPGAPSDYIWPWHRTQTGCKVNIINWRDCAANAWSRGDHAQQKYCEAKARKISGWLEDCIEEQGVNFVGDLGDI